ncbi:NifB/NifX family molybdenum-iron cluster-binding protein [Planktothrix mougeotii]|uniref:Dinitrogenase iron-molybdenum cofactor biosynthesis protein n=1 Tax=Planktothrix mougeotii LEGE 06226 TaxID=1828728 RepID=A0ABR9UBD0_9CYAN|nr:NifB/NifX family molybdenum-iron cluster-binding protein [Planktothrix mougeotii]MBE9143778.1 dinitrogenase iron-molybdenum cofactor biosynthesis protein [Planktothrix mougeotii LEGE 06226]
MKIAVTSQNKTSITEHSGHCRKFWIYEINEGEILGKNLLELSPEQSFHNSSANEPHPLDDVQVLISGGMGKGLVRRLEGKTIEAIITKETDLDKAVNAYLDGSLIREEPQCHEHEGEHQHEHKHEHKHQHKHQHGHQCELESSN